MSATTVTEVSGGSGEVAADLGGLLALAARHEAAGAELAALCASLALRAAFPPSLLEAVLDPVDVWRAEAALVEAQAHLASAARRAAGLGLGLIAAEATLRAAEETVAAGARALALAFGPPRSSAVVETSAVPDGTVSPGLVPGSVADLIRELSEVGAAGPGVVEVQTLTSPEGVRHVVYLPGTDAFATVPGADPGTIRDLAEDARLVGGLPSAYVHGVEEAMREAGVGAGEPVLLVGHSLGGMAALALAASGAFRVAAVVTAGAPTPVRGRIPDEVSVLALEHEGDLVPAADGRATPTGPRRVAVSFATTGVGPGGIVGNHGLDHYLAGARAVDASADPVLAEQRRAISSFASGTDPGPPSATTGTRSRRLRFRLTRSPSR